MNKQVQELWQNLHKQNRFRPKYPQELVVQFVFRNFNKNEKIKILDLGCGSGRHVFFMTQEHIDAYGIDISLDGINHADKWLKENGLSATLRVSSVDSIPFENEFFDGIICYGVLYYLKMKEISKAIEEMRRVLKNGGKGLLVVRTTSDYRYGRGEELEKNTFLINEEDETKGAFNENGMVMHFFEKKELLQLFNSFKSCTIETITKTFDNEKLCDSDYIVLFEK